MTKFDDFAVGTEVYHISSPRIKRVVIAVIKNGELRIATALPGEENDASRYFIRAASSFWYYGHEWGHKPQRPRHPLLDFEGFGRFIKGARGSMVSKNVARVAQISTRWLSKLEKGEQNSLRIGDVLYLADALEIHYEELLEHLIKEDV